MTIKSLSHSLLISTIVILSISNIASANGPDDFGPTPEEQLQTLGISTATPSLENVALNRTHDSKTRYLAVLALGRTKNPNTTSTLISLLSEPDNNVRAAAIIGLRTVAAPESEVHLINVLETDANTSLQELAITAIAAIGSDLGVDAILNAANNPGKTKLTRLTALSSIRGLQSTGRLDYFAVNGRLRQLLKDPDVNIRAMTAHAMAAGGDNSAIPQLAQSALDQSVDQWVKTRAIRDLEKLTTHDFGYFKPVGSPGWKQEREDAVQRINLWWAENRASYETKNTNSKKPAKDAQADETQ